MPLSVIDLDAQARKTGADRAWLAAERAYEAVYSMTGPVCIKKRGIVLLGPPGICLRMLPANLGHLVRRA
jgi:hypothetical protein